MTLESLVLTTLFVLTAVAFIGVVNARGAWRTGIAAVLALGCLTAALWHAQAWRARRAATLSGVAGWEAAQAGGSFSTSGRAGADAPDQRGFEPGTGSVPDGGLEPSEDFGPGDLAALAAGAQALRDSLAAEDPARARALSDSAYQVFERRAEEYVSRARTLRERAARVSVRFAAAARSGSPDSPGFPGLRKGEEVAEALSEALQSLAAAALELRAYFRATGRDEEQRLAASFRRDVEAAAEPLRRAVSGAGALSLPPDFEGREP